MYENETMSFLWVVGNEEERIFWGGRKNIFFFEFVVSSFEVDQSRRGADGWADMMNNRAS